MEKYSIGKVIGKGSYGSVSLVQKKGDSRTLVMKRMRVGNMTQKEHAAYDVEVKLLSQLQHPCVVRFVDSFLDARRYYYCIVMEYCKGGELTDYISDKRKKARRNRRRSSGSLSGGKAYDKSDLLSEREVQNKLVQMTLALEFMHHQHILHRDLKSQNVFLAGKLKMPTSDAGSANSSSGSASSSSSTKHRRQRSVGGSRGGKAGTLSLLKLGDFGISKVLNGSKDFAKTCIGTPYYMSPELFQSQPYNHKSDIWSLGCVLYEMSTFRNPFNAKSLSALVSKVVRGDFTPIDAKYSQKLCALTNAMLSTDVDKRPSAAQILQLPFLQDAINRVAGAIFHNASKYQADDEMDNFCAQLRRLGICSELLQQQEEKANGKQMQLPSKLKVNPSAPTPVAKQAKPALSPSELPTPLASEVNSRHATPANEVRALDQWERAQAEQGLVDMLTATIKQQKKKDRVKSAGVTDNAALGNGVSEARVDNVSDKKEDEEQDDDESEDDNDADMELYQTSHMVESVAFSLDERLENLKRRCAAVLGSHMQGALAVLEEFANSSHADLSHKLQTVVSTAKCEHSTAVVRWLLDIHFMSQNLF